MDNQKPKVVLGAEAVGLAYSILQSEMEIRHFQRLIDGHKDKIKIQTQQLNALGYEWTTPSYDVDLMGD